MIIGLLFKYLFGYCMLCIIRFLFIIDNGVINVFKFIYIRELILDFYEIVFVSEVEIISIIYN